MLGVSPRASNSDPLNAPLPVIAILAVEQSTPSVVHGLFEVFHSVGRAWEELTGEATSAMPLDVRIVARSLSPIESRVGIPIQPQSGFCDADIIIVSDLSLGRQFVPIGQWQPEVRWLRKQYTAGAMICSVGAGSTLLAESGIADGIGITTHWSTLPLLRNWYPELAIQPGRVLAQGGVENRVISAGGASSWQELALHLIAQVRGNGEAVRIAKVFLLGDKEEGQLPFASARLIDSHRDTAISNAQNWLAINFHKSNPVERMASVARLPERTFHRRFRGATGYSAIEYVQLLRIEEAKQLLETSDKTIESIAKNVGYQNPNYFRRVFAKLVGTTPTKYRKRLDRIVSKNIHNKAHRAVGHVLK